MSPLELLSRIGWPIFAKPSQNPLLADPQYAALDREERELGRRHRNAKRPRQAKQALLHDALRRAAANTRRPA